MKYLLIIILSLVVGEQAHCQKAKKKRPIRPKTFDMMIKKDINYAIFGEDAYIQGIETEITKPKVKIKGILAIPQKCNLIWSMALEGGIDEDYISLFKKNQFNNSFSFSTRLDWWPSWNRYSFNSFEIYGIKLRIEEMQAKDKDLYEQTIALAYLVQKAVGELNYEVYLTNYRPYMSNKFYKFIGLFSTRKSNGKKTSETKDASKGLEVKSKVELSLIETEALKYPKKNSKGNGVNKLSKSA